MADQLFPVPLINPASQGLNTAQQGNTALGPAWAYTATNCYFDNAQRLACRKGWAPQANTPIGGSPTIIQTFEFVQSTGQTQVISVASNNHIYSGVNAYTDITGTASTGGTGNWQFVNFNDVVIGFQANQTPIVWTGSGSFAPITAASGSLPQGNSGVSAFGRLWVADSDGHTLKWCGLSDYTNWGAAGSGSIDMRQVWTDGTDNIVGIYAFFARLVVFGQRHIICWEDGSGSSIGLNPSTMVVTDTIEGTGLIARDTVQMVNSGDMVYLSPNGLQSLGRAIIQKNNPLDTLDSQIKDSLTEYLGAESLPFLRSAFSTQDRFYLLILPVNNLVICYDTLFPLQDGRLRVTLWQYLNGGPQCAVYRLNNQGLLFGFANTGVLGMYTGFSDNGNSYQYQWQSYWISGGTISTPQLQTLENKTKIIKRIGFVIYSTSAVNASVQWGYDFAGSPFSQTVVISPGEIPQYGLSEYGANGVYDVTLSGLTPGVDVSQYSGQIILTTSSVPGASAGRWMQFGITCQINGGLFAVQELDAYIKLGRMR